MKKYIAALMLAFTLFGAIGYEAVYPETAYASSRRRSHRSRRRRSERYSRRTVYYRCAKCGLSTRVYSGQRPPRHRCKRGGHCHWRRR